MAEKVSGQTARRERTRAALVASGRELLAEGRTSASIEEITSRAGVGFGSFYNHFESKDLLFREALFSVLDGYVLWLLGAVAELDDPAEVFARSFRVTGRLAARRPELLAPLNAIGSDLLLMERGLKVAAREDIKTGAAQGRFVDDDPEVLVMAVAGALLALIRIITHDPAKDAARITDLMTTRLLCFLGLTTEDATEVVSRPLPDLPDPTSWA